MFYFALAVLIINILFISIQTINANTNDEEIPEMFQVEATAYCDGTITSTGNKVRKGIVAGKPEWAGNVLAVYENENGEIGEFLGYYECLDTGGSAIRNGKVIDIYNPSREWCLEFGRRKVFVHVIKGKG